MSELLKTKVRVDFLINPFYLYPLSFSIALFIYLWGWSDLFPDLSGKLMVFFLVSFAVFIFIGYKHGLVKKDVGTWHYKTGINDLIFWLIILLGLINIILMGYIPLFDRSHNYREFGYPVIDPLFNSLSIFFSVFFLDSFLYKKNKRFLVYFFILLILQVFLFRRSTIVWILISSSFLMIMHYKRISLIAISAVIILIPVFSYAFGIYGNYRSKLSKSFITEDLQASDVFMKSGINYNHYMTYLYIASPLANLQKNINEGKDFTREGVKNLFFYSILPESFTFRLEKALKLVPVKSKLIHPELLVGTFLMISFVTSGWIGMIVMTGILLFYILLLLWLIKKWDFFQRTAYCILSTTVSLLIFSDFLNRLDVLLMILAYPVLFHFIYTGKRQTISPVAT